MSTIVGVCGSLRSASFNMMLLRALAAAAPAGTSVTIASIREIPLYDGDLEASAGIPEPVQRLKESIAKADGLLIVTPEYNNSMPGVLKNTIDWLSRPPADVQRVFNGRPVAVAGATPGLGGTRLSQAAWLPVIRTLGMLPWFGNLLMIPSAGKIFDASGTIVDEATRERARRFIEGFARFAATHSRSRPGADQ
jgi:chromate reductase, NAD(P)H dehydrogenase (quinone)